MFGQTAFRPNEGMATAALVVGLFALPAVSLYGVPGVILGITAIVLGLRARGRIKRSGGAKGGAGRGVGGHDRRPVRGGAGGDVGFLSDAAVPGHDADRS